MPDERWYQRFYQYWQEPLGGRTDEDSMTDEEWYEDYWKNSIGNRGCDNVRRTHTPSRLQFLIGGVLLSASLVTLMWGCDYLASKINPQHPRYSHSKK